MRLVKRGNNKVLLTILALCLIFRLRAWLQVRNV